MNATAQADAGHKQLSGSGIGCVTFVNQEIFISFNKTFQSAPNNVEAWGATSDPKDSVTATVIRDRITKDGFVCKVTTTGRNGNQVCANSSVNWTAAT
jgi:hypothetical protein